MGVEHRDNQSGPGDDARQTRARLDLLHREADGDLNAQEREALLALPDTEVGVSFKTSEGLAPAHVQVRVTALLARTETVG